MIPRTYLDDWKTGRDQTQHLNIYTDGSKMEGGVGAGLYCTDAEIGLSYKLPSDSSIFQAEYSQAATISMKSTTNSSR